MLHCYVMCVNVETEFGLFGPVKLEPDAHTIIMKNVERNHRKKKKRVKGSSSNFWPCLFGNCVLWFWCIQNGLLRLIQPGLGRYVI